MITIKGEATTRAINPPIVERKPFKDSTASRTSFRGISWVYENDHTTGAYSLVRESLYQVAPSRIENTFTEVAMYHARNYKVFESDPVVAVH